MAKLTARFDMKDNISGKMRTIRGETERLARARDRLNKPVRMLITVRDRATSALRRFDTFAARKFPKMRRLTIRAIDRASPVITKVGRLARSSLGKAYRITIRANDLASRTIRNVSNFTQRNVPKAVSTTVRVVDLATRPLRAIASAATSTLGLLGVAGGVGGGIIIPIKMVADREDLTTSFEVMLGSKGAADKRMKDLTEFAGRTPLTRDEIFKSSRILQTFTGDALATSKGMELIGDVAVGTQTDLEETAMWFGRLYDGIDSGRPVGAATSRLQEMGAISGAARQRIEDLAESGGDIKKLWPKVTKEFGKYNGMMEKMSGNMNNLLLGLKSFVGNSILMPWGEGLRDVFKPALLSFRKWRGEYSFVLSDMSRQLKKSGSVFAKNLLNPFKQAFNFIGDQMKILFPGENAAQAMARMQPDEFKEWTQTMKLKFEEDPAFKARFESLEKYRDMTFETRWRLVADTTKDVVGEWWETKGKANAARIGEGIGSTYGGFIRSAVLTLLGGESDKTGNAFVDAGITSGKSFITGFLEAIDPVDLSMKIGAKIRDINIDAGKSAWGYATGNEELQKSGSIGGALVVDAIALGMASTILTKFKPIKDLVKTIFVDIPKTIFGNHKSDSSNKNAGGKGNNSSGRNTSGRPTPTTVIPPKRDSYTETMKDRKNKPEPQPRPTTKTVLTTKTWPGPAPKSAPYPEPLRKWIEARSRDTTPKPQTVTTKADRKQSGNATKKTKTVSQKAEKTVSGSQTKSSSKETKSLVDTLNPKNSKLTKGIEKLGKFVKGVPLISTLFGASTIAMAPKGEKAEAAGGFAGAVAGGTTGAAIGASVGSIVPGFGTAVGGVLGMFGGSMIGSDLGQKVAGWIKDRFFPGKAEAEEMPNMAGGTLPVGSEVPGQLPDFTALNQYAEALAAALSAMADKAQGAAHNMDALTMTTGEASGWVVGAFYPLQGATDGLSHNLNAITMVTGEAAGWVVGAFYPLQGMTDGLQHNISAITMVTGEASGWIVGAFYPLQGATQGLVHNISAITMVTGEASGWVVGAFYPLQGTTAGLVHNISALTMTTGEAAGWIAGTFFPLQSAGAMLTQNTSALGLILGESTVIVAGAYLPLAASGAMANQNTMALGMVLGTASVVVAGAFMPLAGSGPLLHGNTMRLASILGQASGWVSTLNGIQSGATAVKSALSNLAARIASVPTPTVSAPGGGPKAYAKGTRFHPGGDAIVGDGGGEELMRFPNGRMALSPATDTLLNLPRGTEVLSHRNTVSYLKQAPAYAEGIGFEEERVALSDSQFRAATSSSAGGGGSSRSGIRDIKVEITGDNHYSNDMDAEKVGKVAYEYIRKALLAEEFEGGEMVIDV
ncbi:hypothetical protein CSV67_02855 [Sporosarcina sp. P2]|uniref:hypothetical protein n=1 Tax=Sporosarcina sp. P2 TaxID=2048251 RepID=UPI000C16B9BD|nr:hypothetical protein [Sporosarcina sp. P2]PID03599.1 hypothetical protein CSV67_02855 [Sporosarcina sp. P2]